MGKEREDRVPGPEGGPTMSLQLSVELPRGPEAPAIARQALLDCEGVNDDLLPDVRLLVSELITNSVKYGAEGPVRLEILASDERVRAEIIDQGAGFVPKRRNRALEDEGGWGLHLVEQLTDCWGAREGSTHVWFEISSPKAKKSQ